MMDREAPATSIVVPVYNEEACLPEFLEALERMLPWLPGRTEIVLVDDGSSDGSVELLLGFRSQTADVTVVQLTRNFGQHAAIRAGLQYASGDVVVTLDADLQNPPSEVPKLVALACQGHDVVAGWRKRRRDVLPRRLASWAMNRVVRSATGHRLHDYGCMLRAYSRPVVDALLQCPERRTYLPVLANCFARSVAEVEVEHAARRGGESKYSWRGLLGLNRDLLMSLPGVPCGWARWTGLTLLFGGLGLSAWAVARRLLFGPAYTDLLAPVGGFVFLAGLQLALFSMLAGLLGHVNDEARQRPAFIVQHVTTWEPEGPAGPSQR